MNHSTIQLVLVGILVLAAIALVYKHKSGDERFVENIQPEEVGPTQTIVLSDESQCNALCEQNGNRPNVLLAFDPRFQQYNTVKCIYECKRFVDAVKNAKKSA